MPLSRSLSLTVCRSLPLAFSHCFCVSQELNQQTLAKMLRTELTARAVFRNSDLHASGAGDQECDAYTKALDDALQLRDDADALAAGKSTQTQKERQHQARLKGEGDRIRAQSLGMVTSRRNASSPQVSVHLSQPALMHLTVCCWAEPSGPTNTGNSRQWQQALPPARCDGDITQASKGTHGGSSRGQRQQDFHAREGARVGEAGTSTSGGRTRAGEGTTSVAIEHDDDDDAKVFGRSGRE